MQGELCPEHGLEIDHLDEVGNSIDEAVMAVMTLEEVTEAHTRARYEADPDDDRCAGVLVGLRGPRNSAVHDVELFDPDLRRSVGPLEDGRFIVWPRWKPRHELPATMFKTKGGKDMKWAFEAYNQHVAGRLVIDTLMDAYRFFILATPDIVPRLPDGHIEGFPLPPIPIGGYQRLHPEWSNHEEAAEEIRLLAQRRRPPGDKRRVEARIEVPQGRVICGYSVEDGRGSAFTELDDQVARDISVGYPYVVEAPGGDLAVRVEVGALVLDSGPSFDGLVPEPLGAAPPWRHWWDMCVEDAEYYRQQRWSI